MYDNLTNVYMRTIETIYDEYTIPLNLKQHMFRVAAVGEMIMEQPKFQDIDKTSLLAALLIHDLGNVVKFKFDILPEFLEPQGIEYWKAVQEDFRAKYGTDDHQANVLIARELGVPEKVVDLVNRLDFSKIEKIVKEGSWEERICLYADLRVGPHGVLSLAERLSDAQKRYNYSEDDIRYYWEKCAYQLEEVIFQGVSLQPDEITDIHTTEYVKKYPKYQL